MQAWRWLGSLAEARASALSLVRGGPRGPPQLHEADEPEHARESDQATEADDPPYVRSRGRHEIRASPGEVRTDGGR